MAPRPACPSRTTAIFLALTRLPALLHRGEGGRRKGAGKQPPPRHIQAPDSRNFTHRPRGRCWTWRAGLWSWSEPQAHPALFPSCLGLEVNKQLFSACISLFIFKRSKKGSVGNSTPHQGDSLWPLSPRGEILSSGAAPCALWEPGVPGS